MAKPVFPEPNVRRPMPPKMKERKGQFTKEYRAFTEDLRVCYNLVHIGSGILGRPLKLHVGDGRNGIIRAATDGSNIWLPRNHPRRRLVTKHELAHLYFLSRIKLRLVFVKELIRDMERGTGKTFVPPIKERLIEDLCFFINILDDLRVNSLWGLLYPGDGVRLVDWYEGEIGPRMQERAERDFQDGDITNLFTYAILVCMHQSPTSTKWERFRDEFVHCRDLVHYKSFRAMLLIAKDTITRVAAAIAEELEVQEQPPAQSPGSDGLPEDPEGDTDDLAADDAINRQLQRKLKEREEEPDLVKALTYIESELRPRDHFADDDAGFDFQKVNVNPEERIDLGQESRELLRLSDDEVSEAIEAGEEEAISTAQGILAMMNKMVGSGGRHANEESYLTKNVKADINFIRVARRDIVPAVLTPEDVATARRWKRYFQRVMGALAHRTEEAGSVLLTDLYIQQRVNNEPFRCFAHETSGRGFRLNLLVDMSWSMIPIFGHVIRLSAVLQRALDFPFVHIGIYGFNSTANGEVNIYRFPARAAGLLSTKGGPDGVTPISHAIQVVGRDLVGCRDDSHLFMVSDGLPVYRMKGRSGYVDPDTLVNWTHDAVKELRQQKVRTWCFMMGAGKPGRRVVNSMDRMFNRPHWRYLAPEALYDDAFKFIRERFLLYLRTR